MTFTEFIIDSKIISIRTSENTHWLTIYINLDNNSLIFAETSKVINFSLECTMIDTS